MGQRPDPFVQRAASRTSFPVLLDEISGAFDRCASVALNRLFSLCLPAGCCALLALMISAGILLAAGFRFLQPQAILAWSHTRLTWLPAEKSAAGHTAGGHASWCGRRGVSFPRADAPQRARGADGDTAEVPAVAACGCGVRRGPAALGGATSDPRTQVQPIPLAMDFPPLKTEDNSSTLDQRALTIYQAVVDDFRATTLHRHWRGFIPYNAIYAAACEDWRDRFPDVLPPPWDEPIDEWVLNIEFYPLGSGGGCPPTPPTSRF